MKSLEIGWRKCCRSIFKLHYRTHNILIPYLFQTQDIRTIIEERILNFIIIGLRNKNNYIAQCFQGLLINNYSYMLRNLNCILSKHNIPYFKIFCGKKLKLSNDNCVEKWILNLIHDLIYLRDFKVYSFLGQDQINHLLEFLCTM